jgi:hypothetical protein
MTDFRPNACPLGEVPVGVTSVIARNLVIGVLGACREIDIALGIDIGLVLSLMTETCPEMCLEIGQESVSAPLVLEKLLLKNRSGVTFATSRAMRGEIASKWKI